MNRTEIKEFCSWLGRRSYKARLEKFGIERIRDIARENGKKGGRPPKSRKAAKGQARQTEAGAQPRRGSEWFIDEGRGARGGIGSGSPGAWFTSLPRVGARPWPETRSASEGES